MLGRTSERKEKRCSHTLHSSFQACLPWCNLLNAWAFVSSTFWPSRDILWCVLFTIIQLNTLCIFSVCFHYSYKVAAGFWRSLNLPNICSKRWLTVSHTANDDRSWVKQQIILFTPLQRICWCIYLLCTQFSQTHSRWVVSGSIFSNVCFDYHSDADTGQHFRKNELSNI